MYNRETVEEAPGIYRFSEPAGERVINFYGIKEENGWTLIDCGLPGAVKSWVNEGAIEGNINRLIVTHADADHFGSGAWLRAHYPDIDITCHPADRAQIEDHELIVRKRYDVARPAFGFGYPQETLDLLYTICGDNFKVDKTIEGDEVLSIAGDDWVVYHLPGHSAGHIALFRAKDGVLILGDAFLADGPPNILGIPSMPPTHETVTAYLNSIKIARNIEVNMVLSGHWMALDKSAFTELLDKSEKVVARDMAIIKGLLETGEKSFAEIVKALNEQVSTWGEGEYDHYLYAVNGYLKHLEAMNQVTFEAQKIKRI
ncbi:MBL fold metallo-hydrolase [Fulvivirgaceae bacterium BMA12]|uniref:MBL fold metallo-hydrolase n=1 Tax=Agaribacillus aureus TaxID=3051825 RepID=A0ABT8L1E0_9BACT|nr:MBL fold metallo-hydrolase [Fulvivirgaceae bacterium BMA12]